MATYQNYISTLLSGQYKQKIKIVLLRDDETIREEITSLIENSNGNLSVQRANGVRRTVNLTLFNLDNTYIPNLNNFWIHQKFQLYLGLEVSDGTDFWLPQGLFVLDDPSVVSDHANSTINIKGIDKFGLLSEIGGELGYVYIVNSGTNVIQAIKDTLALSGDVKTPIIDTSLLGLTVPYTMTYQPNDKLGKVIVDLAKLYACSCYYNEIGQLVVSKDIDDNTKSSLWDYTTNDFTYLGATNQYKWSELFNSVRVVGSNISGTNVSYKASNTNILSPTSIPNLNNFERIYYYQTDTLDTVQKCTDLANYILYRKTAVQNSVQINSIPMYHFNPDEIITLTDPKLGLNKERYIINDFSISLNIGGKMSLNVVKSKEIPFI